MNVRKIADAVKRLDLNFEGKVVLTEAATGAYVVTPILAALAGGEVYAFTKSTRYGTVEQVREQTYAVADQLGIDRSKLHIIEELTPEIIAKADVITNSGHLRPLNEEKLKYAKPGAVMPLMYEAWEWRDGDLDMDYCRAKNIPVGATNERHPDVDVFSYLGDMAIKQIFDAGLTMRGSRFILLCNNDFGPYIARTLAPICEHLGVCDKEENRSKYEGMGVDWIGNFPEVSIPEKYRGADAVVFTAYPFDHKWIGGENAPISAAKLADQLDAPLVLRYCGDIDTESCKDVLNYFPEYVPSGHMGVLPSAVGIEPTIRLQSGGLKAGELLLRNETHYKNIELVNLM